MAATATVLAAASTTERRRRHNLHARTDDGDGGVDIDFAIVRFKIPGFDDLTQLPRVLTSLALLLLIWNRTNTAATGDAEEYRLTSEVVAAIAAAICWSLPWQGRRLLEAARRQVSGSPVSASTDCIKRVAIKDLSFEVKLDLSWLSSVLLRLSNADGIAIWHQGGVVCTRGVLKRLPGFAAADDSVLTALAAAWNPADDCSVDGYCSTRRHLDAFPRGVLPDKALPGNTESAIIKPIPGGGFLVLWSSKPRAFDRTVDRKWVSNAATKLGGTLNGLLGNEITHTREVCFEDGFVQDADEATSRDPFSRFNQQIRIAPGIIGLICLATLAANRFALLGSRTVIGIDPAQTRSDLAAAVLAVVLVLQGGIWLSETPQPPDIEDTTEWTDSENVLQMADMEQMGELSCIELCWAWNSLRDSTRTSSMTIFWQEECVIKAGLFQPGRKPIYGDFCKEVVAGGKIRYLAQIRSYPVKEQFLDFLPKLTQGLLLVPMRPSRNSAPAGLMVLGLDAIRGMGKVDQAWVAALAEKLAVTLQEGYVASAEKVSI